MLERFQIDLQTPCAHGKFGAQLVLVRLNFIECQWHGAFNALAGQHYGTAPDGRRDHQSEQGCRQETKGEE